jgi:hypothetical protein
MARKLDTQIFWIALLGVAFWMAIWKQDVILEWLHRVWSAAR